jgi:hypothetical protein
VQAEQFKTTGRRKNESMPLKLVLEKLEEVDEPLRPLYKVGGDGKFYLDAEEN